MSDEKKTKVYLIGAGPGDPELLTLKAVRAIKESEAILYDQLVNPEILNYAREGAELVFVGKSKGRHIIPQDKINETLAKMAEKYSTVARLKGGDPFIFGRGGEEIEFMVRHGYCCEVIPGITAASGASASLQIPLTHRDYSSQIIFITGHKKTDGDYSMFRSMDLTDKTAIIYMGVTAMKDIMGELCQNKANCNMPLAVIEKATRPDERLVRGQLGEMKELCEKENIQPPALIIVGNVVHYLDKLNQLKQEFIQSVTPCKKEVM